MGARVLTSVLVVALAAYMLALATHVAPPAASEPLQMYVSSLVFLGAALLCGWRAVAIDRARPAWSLFALGLLLWGLGDLYVTLALSQRAGISVPSAADAGYLALYPLACAGVVALFGSRVARAGLSLWVDGLIAALGVAALAATLVFGGARLTVATNLAYPLADLVLVAFAVGALAMTGWSLRSASAWLAGGLLVFAATDVLHLHASAESTYVAGGMIDAGWPLAALLVAVAAWLPAPRARQAGPPRGRAIMLPLALGLGCLGMLVYDHFQRVNSLAVGLSAAAVLAVMGRLAVTYADNQRMLASSRAEALSDALTGLGNRRALIADLDRALAGHEHALALFDLDGFKSYNDSFGHPAGDSLLARLGGNLGAYAAAQGGAAYRSGGDEFCLLVAAASDVERTISEAAFALTESGEGFSVGCSFGSILVPAEATSAEAALRAVDQRMYEHKQGGQASARSRSTDLLRRALLERDPALERRGVEASRLADAVARRLRLPDGEVETVRLAAELCNVGTVAIPDSILDKPAALDAEETAFVRRHPIIGERILALAPSLASVARLVRSSHERTDGRGYPEGLVGDAIPLGARIVFACDAYVSMVADRAHAAAVAPPAARAELRRCAGTQFDPAVVQALCEVLAEPPVSGTVSLPGSAGPSPA